MCGVCCARARTRPSHCVQRAARQHAQLLLCMLLPLVFKLDPSTSLGWRQRAVLNNFDKFWRQRRPKALTEAERRARMEEHVDAQPGAAPVQQCLAIVYSVYAVLVTLPAAVCLTLTIRSRWKRRSCANPDCPHRRSMLVKLTKAHGSAVSLRLRVSGLMFQSGWTLFCFSKAPLICFFAAALRDEESLRYAEATQPTSVFPYWFCMFAPGILLSLLALRSIDRIGIRVVSCMAMVLYLVHVVLLPSAVVAYVLDPSTLAVQYLVASTPLPALTRTSDRLLCLRLAQWCRSVL